MLSPMFERFTDRARRVLVHAQEEARLLNHAFIGTEHILLGLIHEGEGVAASALSSFDNVTLEAVREKVEATIGMAGSTPSGSPPFTPRAKKVLELSLREALQLGHSYIGTEHILLGLVREGEGVAAQILVSLVGDLALVRQQVVQLMSGHQGQGRAESRLVPPGTALVRSGILVACSFCGRQPPASGRLVAGTDAFICEFCVREWAQGLRDPVRLGMNEPMIPQLVVPAGPPPTDEAAARKQIELAFSTHGTLSDDGRALPMVQGGENLGPTRNAAAERRPDVQPVEIRVDRIEFVDAEHAAVWFSISGNGRPLLVRHRGDAVHIDGTWKMARSTFCELMRMGGIECPPPEPD
jgi:Clp amino terminal domain, pathogenicity island component/ClpX C4-type zinc finger